MCLKCWKNTEKNSNRHIRRRKRTFPVSDTESEEGERDVVNISKKSKKNVPHSGILHAEVLGFGIFEIFL